MMMLVNLKKPRVVTNYYICLKKLRELRHIGNKIDPIYHCYNMKEEIDPTLDSAEQLFHHIKSQSTLSSGIK